MEERTLFAWIHLADLHVGHDGSGWNQDVVMNALVRDVATMPGPARVDWILVTGDVAWRGAPDEYARASEWLRAMAAAAGIDPMWIFVVPGNHDVTRDADGDRQIGRLVEGLRAGREAVDTALAHPDDRALIARRLGPYLEFASGFAPWCLEGGGPAAEHRLYWMRRIRLTETLRVRLVGLDTALLAQDDGDRGRLQLGLSQLAAALNPPIEEVGELVIGMSHHPFGEGWLADQGEALAWMETHAHIHLSAHVHEAESAELRRGSGGPIVRVVAGAMRGAQPSHGYSFCEIVEVDGGGGALALRVWPRKWSAQHEAFRADVDSVPSENLQQGMPYAVHPLRARLPVPEAPAPEPEPEPPPRPVVAKPAAPPAADVFYVYAPEDEALIEGFDAHLAILARTSVITSFDKQSLASDMQAIAAHVARARVFLVLVSPALLVSDFFHGPLMDRALERAARGEAYVVPIYLRPCDWQGTKLAVLEGLPRDGTPVSALDRDTAFADIVFELRHLFRPAKKRRS